MSRVNLSVPSVTDDTIVFFVIRNSTGQYYKTCQSNRPAKWVDELDLARIYAKESMARGKVTSYANMHPKEPTPEIVEFTVVQTRTIDQKSRVIETRNKKIEEEARKKTLYAQQQLEEAEEAFKSAKQKLEKLRANSPTRCDCGSCKSCMGM